MTAAALVLTGAVAVAPAAALDGFVTGSVYRDFNGNGVRDAGNVAAAIQTDVPVEGVTATAYDAAGAAIGSAQTDAAGLYSIDTGAVGDGTPLRIEFTDIPEGFSPSFAGPDNGTHVQFVRAGDEDVDLLINHPDDFAQANAPIFTSIQAVGVPSGAASGDAVVVGTPWVVPNNSAPNYPLRQTLATHGEVGAVWGLSYDRIGNSTYASATYKRHSGLGPLGLGGIYRIDNVLNADGTMTGSYSVEQWLDVSAIGVDVGEWLPNADRGLTGSLTNRAADVDAFAKAGKVGIGGIATTNDGANLLFVNLADRDVYVLDISEPAAPTGAQRVPLAPSLGDGQQPWALEIHHGDVYVGYVDTGDAPGQLAGDADLNAYVVSAPLADVLAGTPSWTPVLTIDLGYAKGNVAHNWGGPGSSALDWATTQPQIRHWNSWTDQWTWDGTTNPLSGSSVGLSYAGGTWGAGVVQLYPQAVLSGLAFDTEGYLTLGFSDRTSIQGGNRNYAAIEGTSGPDFETLASGDTLIAAPNADGTFALENDGVVGDRTTSFVHALNTQGPPGATSREFYNDGQNLGGTSGNHQDISLGAVAAYPGVEQVMSTVYDPLSGIRLGGTMWFNTENGAAVRGYEHTPDNDSAGGGGTFQKGGGIGGVALAQLPPPVQIGDRVWYDADGNGRQDPDEPAIAGAPVTLYLAGTDGAPSGDPLDSTFTDANGQYLFTRTAAEVVADRGENAAAEYVVVFGTLDEADPVELVWGAITPHPALTGLTWGDLVFTDASYGGDDQSQNDSNPDPDTGYAPVTVTGPGQNVHSIDAGLYAEVTVDFTKVLADGSPNAPPGTAFEITVTVEDFRGGDLPDVVFSLEVGDTHEITLPAFSVITGVSEENGDDYGVVITPSIPPSLTVTPEAAANGELSFEVENTIRTYAIGDYVWIDADGNGLQDDADVLPGVVVRLLDGAGDPVLDGDGDPIETTTDADGFYVFDDLAPGEYIVEFELTEEQSQRYLFTTPGAGSDPENDSDATPVAGTALVTGRTAPITLDGTNTALRPQAGVTATEGIDPTWDAGVIERTYAVGDYVWLDANRDGVQDAGESPVEGVTVRLLDGVGAPVLDGDGDPIETTTNADGLYYFDQLPAGTYQVEFELTGPWAAYRFTTPNATDTTGANDSDAIETADDRTIGRTATFVLDHTRDDLVADADYLPVTILATEGIDPTWDAGIVTPTYAVGDYVWVDADRDGLQGDDEVGLGDVTVHLYRDGDDTPYLTTVTEPNGYYVFDDLPEGDYFVEFVLTGDLADEYLFTAPGVGDDVEVDSNAIVDTDPAVGRTPVFTLDGDNPQLRPSTDVNATEGIDPTWDAGVIGKTYAIGDYVWVDANRDGIQDATEAALPGVTVNLYVAGSDEPVSTTFTDGDGLYLFDGLPAGEYTVEFVLTESQSAQYRFTDTGAGSDPENDSDATPVDGTALVTGRTAPITLDGTNTALRPQTGVTATEGIDPTWDAGVVERTYAVGDYVWIDANRDGVQDAGEAPLEGVTVLLWQVGGDAPLSSTETDGDGFYLFDELPAGNYYIEFVLGGDLADQYRFTVPNAGGDDTVDSDAVVGDDRSIGRTANFALYHLRDDLVAGSDYGDGVTVLASEGIDPTWDAGVVTPSYAVGDYVWIDANRDGVQNDGDTPLGGVIVRLLDAAGDPVLDGDGDPIETVTDSDGYYLFDGLDAGDYRVQFVLTEEQSQEYRFTQNGAGDDPALDSDADPVTGISPVFTLDGTRDDLVPSADYGRGATATEGVDPTWDAGVVGRSYAVGDFVWIDANRDGIQDAGEAPLAGVTVNLYRIVGDEEIFVDDTTTNDEGHYLFDNLIAGEYFVEFVLTEAQSQRWLFTTPDAGGDDTVDSDAVPTADQAVARTASFVLDHTRTDLVADADYAFGAVTATEGIDPTWDAGVVERTYAVGDYVWIDANRDGIQDAGEEPLGGVTVRLYEVDGDGSTLVATTTTDDDGYYLFDELPAGDYEIVFELGDLGDRYRFTQNGTEPGAGDDSDADPVTGRTPVFTLDHESVLTPAGDYAPNPVQATEGIDPTWDAGVIVKTYAVGDYVWIDANRDGIQDAGEPALEGVAVNLYRDGETTPLATTTTNADGFYVFDDLLPGDYRVQFVLTSEQAAEYEFTLAGVGGDSAADSNADPDAASPDFGFSPVFTLDDHSPLVPSAEYDLGGAVLTATEGIDPTWDAGVRLIGVPDVSIDKFDAVADGDGWTRVNDADTLADGAVYQAGETRTIVIEVTNQGNEPLREVVLTDSTVSGGQLSTLAWTLPGGEEIAAEDVGGALVASWDATFGAGIASWLPGETIVGVATLTVALADEPHVNVADVSAVGDWSGRTVAADDPYSAFTGGIQVIKYDGGSDDPVVRDDDGAWVIPAKPLADPAQDANDRDNAVEYPVDTEGTVRWVVTNTGTTALTGFTVVDVTGEGPAIGDDWTADLSDFGGPADYSFVESGPWDGVLPAGASFFATGSLTLPATTVHNDTVEVEAVVVVPGQDPDTLEPTGEPALDDEQNPIRATLDDGETPFTVTDDDPYFARSGVGPYVDIEKGDGTGTTIANDADSITEAVHYEPGEARTIVYTVENTGDEDLREVVLTDSTLSGAAVEALTWTLPDGTTRSATLVDDVWTFEWAETFGEGTALWLPGEVITGSATLTVALTDQPHVNRVVVDAAGALSGIPVTDVDDYNALTSGIQVIKYDGALVDPVVRDDEGDWVIPAKPLVDAAQDANDTGSSVQYRSGEAETVRWVVTNTGTTWLTGITLADATLSGPAIAGDWTADLSAFGGPARYSFVDSGAWTGLLPPGASFFATATLTLGDGDRHANEVTVVASPVTPAVDENGVPTGEPLIGDDGLPVLVLGPDGSPITVGDSDPFHAHTVLPITGAQVAMWVLLPAAALILAGLLLFLVARNRRGSLA